MKIILSLLLASTVLIPAGAAAQSKPAAFKTGEYQLCNGSKEECLRNEQLGPRFLRFEKSGVGKDRFVDEEQDFYWRIQGSEVIISPLDGKPFRLEIRDNGEQLFEKNDAALFVMIEDEDEAFRPGVYFRCGKNTPEACAAEEEAFAAHLFEDAEPSFAYMTLNKDEGSHFCAKDAKDCKDLTWTFSDDGTRIEVSVGPGNSSRFRIDRNMLVDEATGGRWLRAFSEEVMRSAN